MTPNDREALEGWLVILGFVIIIGVLVAAAALG